MLEAFRAGGFGMIPTSIFGLMLLATSVQYLMAPSKRMIPLMISLGILSISAGALGFVAGFIKSVDAIATAPGASPVLALLGAGEAANCLALALGLITLASIAASGGAFRLARMPEREA